MSAERPWSELKDSGLLWLINRVVFHPRGFALGLCMKDGVPVGWRLLGDGSDVWAFSGGEEDHFSRVEKTFTDQRTSS